MDIDQATIMARARVYAGIVRMHDRASLEIRLRAAAHRARIRGKNFRRSLGQLRRWNSSGGVL
jgi:hypothetical protein